MNYLYKSILWLASLLTTSLFSLGNEIPITDITYIGVEQGLSNNDVNCLYQSTRGFMWIGTADGLNRYDGNQISVIRKTVDNKNSLPSNRILDLIEDNNHNLLVSTSSGLTLYDPLRKTFNPISFINSKNEVILIEEGSILEKSNEHLFLGTKTYGLLEYENAKENIRQIPLIVPRGEELNYIVKDIYINEKGDIWVIIEGKGIAKYNPRVRKLNLVHSEFKDGNCLLEDFEGNFILGTQDGLVIMDNQFKVIHSQKTGKEVINLNRFNNQEVWASTDGAGILIKSPNQLVFEQTDSFGLKGKFSSSSMKEVLLDKNNNYWIATVRGGINIINGQRKIFTPSILHVENNPKMRDPHLTSFCEISDKELWVSTDGFGIFSFNKDTKEYKKLDLPNLKSQHITNLLKDKNGTIWVASWSGGVQRLVKGSNNLQTIIFHTPNDNSIPKNIWKLYLDKKGNLWASTYGDEGLFIWEEKSQSFISYSKDFKNVLTFAEDNYGNLWMGSDDYLIRHHLPSKKNQFFKLGFRIRAILPEKNQKLWIGTEGSGLLHFDNSNGKYRVYDESRGFSNNNILNILPDNQSNLWCSTFNGLNKFDLASKTITKFSDTDGLQNNRFNYQAALKLSTGELVFGGQKGLNLFSPQNVHVPSRNISIQLTGLKINGIDISDSQNWSYVSELKDGNISRLDLPYDKSSLSISYSSFDFGNSADVEFQVLLEGLTTEWVSLNTSRTINYSRLSPGNYKLQIRAIGRDQKIHQASLINFHISEPWYLSKISIILYCAIGLLIVSIYIRISKNRTKLKYEAKLANIEKEKEKEFGEKKLQFFSQTLQELKTPITMLINPLKELINSGVLENDKNLLLANRNANRLLVLTEQFEILKDQKSPIKIPNVKELDILALLINEFDSFKELAKEKSVDLAVHYNASELMIFANQQKIELVLFNLILNAIENVNSGGKVNIAVKELHDKVQISVSDNAEPILKNVEAIDLYDFYDKIKQDNGSIRLELLMVYQMVKEHYGNLNWKSSELGNTITVELNKGDWFSHYKIIAQETSFEKDRMKDIGISKENLKEQTNKILLSNKNSILIVEDDTELMNYLRDIFSMDYIIYEATDIGNALDKIKTFSPNLILTEAFSDGCGYDFCKTIKEDQKTMHLPVLIMSSSNSNGEELKSISAGAEDFISKPFDQSILKAKVQTIFEGRNILQQYFLDHITLKENHSNISIANKEFLDSCILIIESNLENTAFNSKLLAVKCNMSYSNLYKKIRTFTGLSISSFIRVIRLKRAAVLMLSTDHTIHEIAFKVGIQDIKYFREKFKEVYELTPSNYIKKYRPIYNREYSIIKK